MYFWVFLILAKNKKIKFFGQIIKLILQSINDEKDLTNFLQILKYHILARQQNSNNAKKKKYYKNETNKGKALKIRLFGHFLNKFFYLILDLLK